MSRSRSRTDSESRHLPLASASHPLLLTEAPTPPSHIAADLEWLLPWLNVSLNSFPHSVSDDHPILWGSCIPSCHSLALSFRAPIFHCLCSPPVSQTYHPKPASSDSESPAAVQLCSSQRNLFPLRRGKLQAAPRVCPFARWHCSPRRPAASAHRRAARSSPPPSQQVRCCRALYPVCLDSAQRCWRCPMLLLKSNIASAVSSPPSTSGT